MAQFYSAKQRVTTQQRITVTIEDLDPFGQGVARYKGKTLFVSGALPGEQAEVTLLEDKRQYARAKAVRLLNHSPSRVARAVPILAAVAVVSSSMSTRRYNSKVNHVRWHGC